MTETSILRPSGKEQIPLGSGIITRLLGDGGMASVYEIWNDQLEVHRAVKLLHPNCNNETRERFQTEIKITAKMHHPNIVEIHGVGEWNGIPYIEMEKADGVTLEQLIQIRGALPVEVSLAIGIMVSNALDYAHNHEYTLYNNNYHGVIHRDLKPGNIMVCKDGVVKLMDFGIARPATTSFHTIDGAIIGTLQYLSPEQLESCDLDITSDIYSLGICLYEMVCGHLAFPENNISHLLADKSKNRYKPLYNYELRLPSSLIETIQSCMTHDKSRRPQSAASLGDELARIYEKICQDKPETIVATFLDKSFKERVVPKIHNQRLFISKRNLAALFVTFIMLFIILSVSSRKLQKHHVVTKTTDSLKSTTSFVKSDTTVINTIQEDSAIVSEKADSSAEKNFPYPKKDSSRSPQKTSQTKKKPDENDHGINKLKTKYDTDDLLMIAQKEIADGNYSNALAVLKYVDPAVQKSTRAQVLKARALEKIDYRAYSTFIFSISKNEAELLICKARHKINTSNFSEASELLARASIAPREIISSDAASKRIVFYNAIIASGQFDAMPDESHWREALEAWYIVKKEMRNDPKHEYYVKADYEINRISKKFRSKKG